MKSEDSNLLTARQLQEYFLSVPYWKVFWGSFEEVFLKNYWNNSCKEILTPVVFKIVISWKAMYVWKLITLNDKKNINFNIEWSLEAKNLLLLMSYLVKDYLQDLFSEIDSEMTFKEIALIFWDRQFIVGERVRQLFVSLCNDLAKILDEENIYE